VSTAAIAPRPKRWANRLPRWLRVTLMAALFLCFFAACPLLALIILPALRLFLKDYRDKITWLLNKGLYVVIWWARFMGTVDFETPSLPPGFDPKRPHVLISNHPTFVDMLLVLGSFPYLSCVTSGRWSRHWALGPLLRWTHYLPGPGSGLPQAEDMLGSMVEHLKSGYSLLIFPEGQRSHADSLRRFRRGAVAAAVRAGVPIVPLFVGIDRPYLTKEVPLSRPPSPAPTYTFEWFDVIEPGDFDGDEHVIQEHLVQQYQARFDAQRALQLELSPG